MDDNDNNDNDDDRTDYFTPLRMRARGKDYAFANTAGKTYFSTILGCAHAPGCRCCGAHQLDSIGARFRPSISLSTGPSLVTHWSTLADRRSKPRRF